MVRFNLRRPFHIVLLALAFALGTVPRALAQPDKALLVSIVRVESKQFPQVTTSLAVLDERGVPVTGLEAKNFQIVEDGSPLDTSALRVEPGELDALRVVLVVDTSLLQSDLSTIQDALHALVEKMGPEDQVALIAFASDVRPLQRSLTNNKVSLRSTIDALAVDGVTTQTGEAAVAAITLAASVTDGHPVVLLLTDSGNVSQPGLPPLSDEEATPRAALLDQIGAANVPLYVISFGSDVPVAPLRAMTDRTAGQLYRVPTADDVRPTLETLTVALRGGYRLQWRSQLPADDEVHTLSIVASVAGRTAHATRPIVAASGEVLVALPGLSDGQTIDGPLSLVPDITAPAPLERVEFLLDDEPIGEAHEAPFSMVWPATDLQPGRHALTVRAVDAAGNSGEARRTLTVAPLSIRAVVSEAEVRAGKRLTVEATIEASAEIASVQFLIDGNRAAVDTAPPYRATLDSGRYGLGPHTVTARVQTVGGHTAEASVPVEVVPGRPTSAILWLVGVLLTLLLLAFLLVWQHRFPARRFVLELSNQSNVPMRYALHAEDDADALCFQFVSQRRPLRVRERGERQIPSDSLTLSNVSDGAIRAAAHPKRPLPSGAAVSRTLGLARAIAGMLSMLAYLLPGGAGAGLRRTAGQLRTGELAASRTQQLSGQVARTREAFSGGPSGPPRLQAPPTPPPTVAVPTGASAPPVGREVATQTVEQVRDMPTAQQAPSVSIETPEIGPGEPYRFVVLARSRRTFAREDYPFIVTATPLDDPHALPLTQEETLPLASIPLYLRYLPLFFFAVTVSVLMVAIAFLLLQVGMVATV